MKILDNIINEFKMTEILLTVDVEKYNHLLSVLKKNNISYKTKLINSGTQNRRTGELIGQIGEDVNYEIMYYVYVGKKDAEDVRCILKQ